MKKTHLLYFILISVISFTVLSGCSKTTFDDPASEKTEQKNLVSSISLSEFGDEFKFDPSKKEYSVTIPDGRPKIPQISAEAEECELKILQAAFPEGASEASAYVSAKLEDKEVSYLINFKKSAEKGFVLQYKDVYDLGHGRMIFQ